MNDTFFTQITELHRLGTLTRPVVGVPGGFLHRMFRLDTASGTYACKVLNPEIMARPTAAENFDRAEALETALEQAGLPVVSALVCGGRKRQHHSGIQYCLFPWIDGKSLLPDEITPAHCRHVASLLARMHNIAPCPPDKPFADNIPGVQTDWQAYLPRAEESCPDLAEELRQNIPLLVMAENRQNEAIAHLPGILCISHGDMDPKNVLWTGESPHIIDLECLGRDNPAAHAVQLSQQWGTICTGSLAVGNVIAFLEAYVREAHWVRDYSVDWAALVGLGYNWTDWADYNLRRALGLCSTDQPERLLGREQFRLAVRCIHTLAQAEETLRKEIAALAR